MYLLKIFKLCKMTQLLRRVGDSLVDDQQRIVLYSLDTPTTVKHRIGVLYSTLPQHLHVEDNVVTLLTDVLHASRGDVVKAMVDFGSMFEPREILYFWLSYRDYFQSKYGSPYGSFLLLTSIIEDRFPTLRVMDIENEVEFHRQTDHLTSTYRDFVKETSQQEFILQTIDALAAETEQMTLREEQVKTAYTFMWKESLEALYDQLQTTRSIPVILLRDYVKVFTPADVSSLSIHETENDQIRLVTASGESITLLHTPETGAVELFTHLPNAEQLVQQVCHVQLDWTVKTEVKGVIEFDQRVNMMVFADMLMSYEHHQFRLVDVAAFNDNVNLYLLTPVLDRLLHLQLPFHEELYQTRMTVSQQRTQFHGAMNVLNWIPLQMMLRCFMTIYRKTEYEILRSYEEAGIDLEPDHPQRIPLQSTERINLTQLYPEIFRKGGDGYKSKCQPPHRQPIPLFSEEEEKEAIADGYLTFRFPKEPIQLSPDRILPVQIYRCRDRVSDPPKYPSPRRNAPYPGLTTDPASIVGFVPCCQVKPQETKLSSAYVEYYFPDRYQPSDQTGYIRIGSGILEVGKTGRLPESRIASLFSTLTNLPVEREGMEQGPNSFLDCIAAALGVTTRRRDLVSSAYLCAQENPDRSINEIGAMLDDATVYLDPQRFIACVQAVYSCHVLLFRRDETTDDLVLPYHTHGYVQFERDLSQPTVLVYVHSGSKRAQLPYNHCELLRVGGKAVLTSRDLLHHLLWKTVEQRYSFHFASVPLYPIRLPLPFDVLAQFVDSKGKVRHLNVRWKNKSFTIETSPLPVLPNTIVRESFPRIGIVDETHALEFLTILKCHRKELNPELGYVAGWFNFYVRIYTKPDIHSQEDIYILYEQTSRYLVEWCLYLFAKQQRNITEDAMVDFIKTHTIVKPNHRYQHIPPVFDESQATGVIENGKVVCSSPELRQRLLFRLLQLVQNDTQRIRTYATKHRMENYYKHNYDFKSYPRERLFRNPDRLLPSSDTTKTSVMIPQLSERPYFLNNANLRGRVQLAQQAPSLDAAATVGMNWLSTRVNRLDDVETGLTTMVSVMQTPETVENVLVRGSKKRTIPSVVVFQQDGQTHYQALLNVS